MPLTSNLSGPQGRLYADPKPSPDETSFQIDNTSNAYYNSVYYTQHKNDVQPIPPPRQTGPLDLSDFLPEEITDAVTAAGRISFHAVGDTGAANVNRTQTAATALGHQAAVADAMVADVQKGADIGPAFFFHLGDVIYNFGEAQYYYDQFYEPYREYDRPIFAIPGNHDGMVFGSSSSAPQVPTLAAFLTNFCAAVPGESPDAGGLVRSVMTQPGVYFTLDAPFVSIIGIYSNVLDGPGVISSQGGQFPLVNDQLTFLQSELERLKPEREAGERAVILAVHHPPLSVDAKHAGSTGVEADIETCCEAADLWPDAILSGHAHLYQRFTRDLPSGKQIPYIVSGSGGYNITKPQGTPPAPYTIGDYTLEVDPIVDYGYLTLTTDGGGHLDITFRTADETGVSVRDAITVDLVKGTVSEGSTFAAGVAAGAKKTPAGKKKSSAKPAPKKTAKKQGKKK
jgi:hypothetical protein